MNHGSLFSGIGGFDYAADLMEWTNIFHCEIESFPKWRNESIKAGGNAIVPQVALQIFKAIEQYESLTH